MHNWTPNQKLWIEALRSGKFKQTQKVLKRGDSFCCLGIACVLAGLEAFNDADDSYGSEHETSELTPKMADWLQIKSHIGDYEFFNAKGERCYGSLVGLNDDDLFTFKQIADFIEQNPEHIFQ